MSTKKQQICAMLRQSYSNALSASAISGSDSIHIFNYCISMLCLLFEPSRRATAIVPPLVHQHLDPSCRVSFSVQYNNSHLPSLIYGLVTVVWDCNHYLPHSFGLSINLFCESSASRSLTPPAKYQNVYFFWVVKASTDRIYSTTFITPSHFGIDHTVLWCIKKILSHFLHFALFRLTSHISRPSLDYKTTSFPVHTLMLEHNLFMNLPQSYLYPHKLKIHPCR